MSDTGTFDAEPFGEASFEKQVVETAMALAAERGWRRVGIGDIAAAMGVPQQDVTRAFSCKASILAAQARLLDDAVMGSEPPFDAEDGPRDRLFEVLMLRFEELNRHRAGMLAVLRDLPADPATSLASAPALLRSMARMLEAAGIESRLPLGPLRAKGLAAVWLATVNAWVSDDTPDLARTMAALDRNLRRIEPFASALQQPFRAPFGRRSFAMR